jgi:Zn-dependent membrane protease YugP
VISVAGQLTDHYNPVNKTVNLSEAVYNQRNAAAAAVAAHECGHAVQHAVGYQWLTMRSKLVPLKCGIVVHAMDSDRWNFIDE